MENPDSLRGGKRREVQNVEGQREKEMDEHEGGGVEGKKAGMETGRVIEGGKEGFKAEQSLT